MAKNRKRKHPGRQLHRRLKLQPKRPNAQPAQASLPIVLLPFLNLAGLSREEIATARHLPSLQCASCDGTKYLTMAASWRNASGTPYIAAFCGLCIKEAGTPAQKEPFEIEMRIDLALFEAASEKAESALAEGEVCR